jgi:hypothetical protein
LRFRSLPLDAERSVNSCGYQIQAQLPDTVIPQFVQHKRAMQVIRILARDPVNRFRALFSAPQVRKKCSTRD